MNATTLPSSIRVGIATSTAFLHSCRTLTRDGSTSNAAATLRSCSRTFSNGFSLRCDSGASTAVTGWLLSVPTIRWSLDGERQRDPDRLAGEDGPRHELDAVRARREPRPLRVTTGQAEGEAPRQHVAETRDHAEPMPVCAEQAKVDPRHGLDLGYAAVPFDASGAKRQDRRGLVRRREAPAGEPHPRDERRAARPEADRPRHADRSTPVRRDQDRAAPDRIRRRRHRPDTEAN